MQSLKGVPVVSRVLQVHRSKPLLLLHSLRLLGSMALLGNEKKKKKTTKQILQKKGENLTHFAPLFIVEATVRTELCSETTTKLLLSLFEASYIEVLTELFRLFSLLCDKNGNCTANRIISLQRSLFLICFVLFVLENEADYQLLLFKNNILDTVRMYQSNTAESFLQAYLNLITKLLSSHGKKKPKTQNRRN
jgi:hypothetical protein